MSTQPTLAQLQAWACRDIDRKAGEIRRLWLSDPFDQRRVYDRKHAQAVAYLAALELDPGATPGRYIGAEAARCGMSAAVVAARVIDAAAREDQIGPDVEAERTGGKKDVRAAADPAAVASALAASLAALQAIAQALDAQGLWRSSSARK